MANWWKNIVTFKDKFREVFTKENIEKAVDEIKEAIEKYEEHKNLTGEEKKQRVDEHIIEWLDENWHSDNDKVQWVINRVIDLTPIITQICYNLLVTKFTKLKDREKEKEEQPNVLTDDSGDCQSFIAVFCV